jgi:hypothetical protein
MQIRQRTDSLERRIISETGSLVMPQFGSENGFAAGTIIRQ